MIGYLIAIAVIAGIAIFLLWWFPRKPVLQKPAEVSIIPFTQICSIDAECELGMVCETFCKKKLGEKCTSIYECTSAANVCSGTCQWAAAIGGLGESCPCNEGLICADDISTFQKSCKKISGYPCSSNSECATGVCEWSGSGSLLLCMAGKQLGATCSVDSQCESNNCSSGFCQLPGKDTGEIDAYCDIGLFPAVAGCFGSSLCITNRCQPANQGLLNLCDAKRLCNPEYQCYTSVVGTGGGSMCTYPFDSTTGYTYTNKCPLGQCSDGFTCNGSSNCLANTSMFADAPTSCLSSAISTNDYKIWRWRTTDSKWVLHDSIGIAISDMKAVSRRVSSVIVDELCFYRTATNDILYKNYVSATSVILPSSLSPGNCLNCPGSSSGAVPGGVQTITYSFVFTGLYGVSSTYLAPPSTADTSLIAVGVYHATKVTTFTPTSGPVVVTNQHYYAVAYYNSGVLRMYNFADTFPGCARDTGSNIIGSVGSSLSGWLYGIDCTSNSLNQMTVGIVSFDGTSPKFYVKGDITSGSLFGVRSFNVAPLASTGVRFYFYRLGNATVDKYVSYVDSSNRIHIVYNQYVSDPPSGITSTAYLPLSPQAPTGPYQIVSYQAKSVFLDGGVTPQDVTIDRSAYIVSAGGQNYTFFFDGVQYYVPGYPTSASRIAVGDNFIYMYTTATCL